MSDTAILIIGIFAFGCVVAVCMTVDSVAARKHGGKGAGRAKAARDWPQMPMWTYEKKVVMPEGKKAQDQGGARDQGGTNAGRGAE